MNKSNENPTRALLIEFNDWDLFCSKFRDGGWGGQVGERCSASARKAASQPRVRDIDDHEVEAELATKSCHTHRTEGGPLGPPAAEKEL